MDFKKIDEERYQEYIDDLEIARKELMNMKLFPEYGILCDMYAIPSHNQQAYYCVVYENGNRLDLVYAKPEIYSSHSEVIKMYPFKFAKEAEKYPSVEGRIIMGIKTLSSEFVSIIKDVVYNIPKEFILGENAIYIDGVFQGVRVFKDGKVIRQIAYKDANKIFFPKEKEYLKEILDNLYFEVGKIINQEI